VIPLITATRFVHGSQWTARDAHAMRSASPRRASSWSARRHVYASFQALGRRGCRSLTTPMHISRPCTRDAALMTRRQHRRGVHRDGQSLNSRTESTRTTLRLGDWPGSGAPASNGCQAALTDADSASVWRLDHQEPCRCETAARARVGSRRDAARRRTTQVPRRFPARR
jgi:hypothetical protein